jgi:hypothetical protein
VDAKYGCSRGGWCSSDPPGAYGVGLWKYIRRGWSFFSSHTRFDPEDQILYLLCVCVERSLLLILDGNCCINIYDMFRAWGLKDNLRQHITFIH